jgi:DNA-nicking Smr family endonuclease
MDFGAILDEWERRGSKSKSKSKDKAKDKGKDKAEDKKDKKPKDTGFGAILDKWEGKSSKGKGDFGAILDRWEKRDPNNRAYNKDVSTSQNNQTNQSTPPKQSSEASGACYIWEEGRGKAFNKDAKGARRSRLLKKKPDAYIDLHGLNRDEAQKSLELFFEDSLRRGFEKVQIIHGKGIHSDPVREGLLRELSRRFIENCPYAGESGYASAREGGKGATWVILKGG